jgi:hypothetical protein
MSYKFPEFKSGNKSFANALNAIVKAAKRHGVNPGGRPGWVETDKGWLPPHIFSDATVEFRWDLIPAPDDEGQFILRYPSVAYSREDIESEVVITNNPMTLANGDWVIAKMAGPIDTFLETPTITIEAADTWDGFPSAHQFGGSEYEWQATRIPIYKVQTFAEGADKKDAIGVGEALSATKLIGPYPTLAFTLAEVPDAGRTRVVPTFV